MKGRFYYSRQAKADLRRVLRASSLFFGPNQTRRYADLFEKECLALSGDDSRGRSVMVRDVTYLMRHIGSHTVICLFDPDRRMRVVRILHSRMDFERHL